MRITTYANVLLLLMPATVERNAQEELVFVSQIIPIKTIFVKHISISSLLPYDMIIKVTKIFSVISSMYSIMYLND